MTHPLRKGIPQQELDFTIIFLLFFVTLTPLKSLSSTITLENVPYQKKIIKIIKNGKIYSSSKVESFVFIDKKQQKLDFSIAGLHPKSCRYSLRKLSQYENYKKFLDFVKISTYDEKKERIYLLLSSKILPFKMILNFKIPRIKRPGAYPFNFDNGLFPGLKGQIHVSNYKGRCFFYTIAHWDGPETKFSNSVFEFFSKALSQMSMERLFQVSNTF